MSAGVIDRHLLIVFSSRPSSIRMLTKSSSPDYDLRLAKLLRPLGLVVLEHAKHICRANVLIVIIKTLEEQTSYMLMIVMAGARNTALDKEDGDALASIHWEAVVMVGKRLRLRPHDI